MTANLKIHNYMLPGTIGLERVAFTTPDYGQAMFVRIVEGMVCRLDDDEWRRVKERRDAR